jgi:acetylornithine deacetylase/succinyl-diaminopimelate desuccinylase-like protein
MLDEGLFIITPALIKEQSAGAGASAASSSSSVVTKTVPLVPGHPRPVAMVCIAEKGYLSVQVETHSVPGHASVPPIATAIGTIARAAAAVESSPMPLHFSRGDPAWLLFEHLAPSFESFAMKVVCANLWLFGGLFMRVLASKPKTAALVRTTSALTMISAGEKENVLPSKASLVCNHRVLAADISTAGKADELKCSPCWSDGWAKNVLSHDIRSICSGGVCARHIDDVAADCELVAEAAKTGLEPEDQDLIVLDADARLQAEAKQPTATVSAFTATSTPPSWVSDPSHAAFGDIRETIWEVFSDPGGLIC